MTPLRAPWLGSWTAPWGLGRGRRWGDLAWALAAIAQAWMLGGREGRWPEGTWEARRPQGPRLAEPPSRVQSQPPPAWVALLRHGTPKASPELRGASESDLVCRCWQELLAGDASGWMALGSVLFDRPTRTRWIPVLGAVDDTGAIVLPPFLEPLLPPWLKRLPEGWWECLLSHMDASGRLLPDPSTGMPTALFEADARAALTELLLPEPPPGLTDPSRLVQLQERVWMVDPRMRAWGRGWGPCPAVLATLQPPSLGLGDPLREDLPTELPDSGAEADEGCADPFRWLARARRTEDPPEALRAYAWAHAHFKRLRAPAWVRQVSAEAADTALDSGDLAAWETWRRLRGPLDSPARELEDARVLAASGDWEHALARLRLLAREHPGLSRVQELRVQGVLLTGRVEGLDDARDHLSHPGLRRIVDHLLASGPLPEALDPDAQLLWTFHQRQGAAQRRAVWQAWEACGNASLRLETGLRLLEEAAEERTPVRLMALQALADRAATDLSRSRLQALWPSRRSPQDPCPKEVLEHWLSQRTRPTWILWDSAADAAMLGTGTPPPQPLLEALREHGELGPVEAEGSIWWGRRLHWEGGPVGHLMAVLDPHEAPADDPQVISPWVARLVPAARPEPGPHRGRLLCDGSEPMGSVLAELDQVAPSGLPVLILGPTGSGKELVARELHARSGRTGPFIAINCSEYAETLLESELFGHVKGAFTSADRERKGVIESAEGGTLFVDEIADLSPQLQALFLRVLQEKEVRRVGSDRVRRINVRFLSATHHSLDQMAAEGKFRKDLLFRLKGTVLRLPSLAERRHEFPYLIPRLLAQVAEEMGKAPPEPAPGLALALARLPWQGNVRELRHALERALLRCGEGPLKTLHFTELDRPATQEKPWDEATRTFQANLLLRTLRQHHCRITETARVLGLTRPALYLAAKRLGLDLARERAFPQGAPLR